MKQTKIVASISDRRCDQDFIRKLFFAGMNVVRMNTAHATEEGIRTIVKNVRAVSPHIGIMIDTKGPEVRTTGVKEPIHYNVGDVVKIFGRPEMESSHDIVNVSYPDIAADVKVGDDLLFDDGELDMKIIDSQGPMLVAEVQNEGVLGAHKSVNVPGEHIDLPALTEKDRRNIELAIELDIDFIAHSFVRNAADVKAVQDIFMYTMMGCCKLADVDFRKCTTYFLQHIHEYDDDYSKDLTDFFPHILKKKGLV